MRDLLTFYLCFTITLAVLAIPNVQAQDAKPVMPAPVKTLVEQGAQIRYLGDDLGMNGWIAILSGQEQFFYATKDGRALLSGHLFDENGKSVTLQQVKKLQQASGAETLDFFTSENTPPTDTASTQSREFKTPSEQLYDDVSNGNWIMLGKDDAPFIYTFVDPQCPHCHAFINDLRMDYIETGKLQVRMIPIGFEADTIAQAAFLLAVPNPQKRLYDHLAGDETAIPVTPDINQQGVEKNLAIMHSWKFNVTPLTVYKNAAGEVKIIQGRAKSVPDMLKDITG